ncbi:uncharacterized protein PHA67_023681 [Liasis olivaceus]
MDARAPYPETQRLWGQADLQRGPFQTPEERAQLRAAVYQDISATMNRSFSRWGTRGQTAQPLEQDVSPFPRWWGSRGLASLLVEEASEVLAVLERKYQALQRKLCEEMLRGHFGQQLWTSLAQHTKEEKLLEMMALVELALPEGSLLPISSLPGAGHRISSGVPPACADFDMGHCRRSAPEQTAGRALLQLRQRRQAEAAALLAQSHLLEGRNPETSRQLLRLHAQAELVQKEATLQGALLAVELLTGERFWDSQPSAPEACHRELAELRLAAGQRAGLARQQAKMVSRRSMKQVVLDQLLLLQERDRSSLIKTLMVLVEPEAAHGQARHSMEPTHLGEGRTGFFADSASSYLVLLVTFGALEKPQRPGLFSSASILVWTGKDVWAQGSLGDPQFSPVRLSCISEKV